MKVKIKGKVDILSNFPIDTSLKKKTHSAMLSSMTVTQDHYCSINATQDNTILKGLQGMGARMTTIIIMVPTTKMMVVMMMSI